MSDLHRSLQSALGSEYTIEREIGGGGMSRVFLATQTRFNRLVVIKLLAPSLADGLSTERFTREIGLAASLQQANIVPLLSAGEAHGSPWYSMPYVEGESLRARLARGPVSLHESLAMLRDVARALAYAHERGIVHRDIKPENILLSGGAAVVTDFGIAKALSAARTAAPDATLTQVGTSIGTPAYMAPEQAVGDLVDGRADVYAWGVVAYELLSGQHPFAGKSSPQQLIAAHVAERPAPLPASLPQGVADLVHRALAKEADARPTSGQSLLEQLDEAARDASFTATSPPRASRRRRISRGGWVALVTAILAATAAGAWFVAPVQLRTLVMRSSARLTVNRVVVAPLSNETGDPSLDALGGLASAYLTESLSQVPQLQLVDAQTAAAGTAIVGATPRLLRRGNERALADETGAGIVVAGSYFLEDGQVTFRMRVLDGVSGTVRQAIPAVRGSRQKPTAALTQLATRVAGALAVAAGADSAPQAIAPSLEAYKAWVESMENYLRGGNADAVLSPLRTALRADSSWATGFSGLAFFAWGVGDLALADSALAKGARVPPPQPTVHKAMEASLQAQAIGDAAGGLRAAQAGPLMRQYIAFLAYANARPRLAIATLMETDPDRGINLIQPRQYFDQLIQSYLWLGEWNNAQRTAREWQRREPGVQTVRMETAAYVAAVAGNVDALTEQLRSLERIERGGDNAYEQMVVNATTLLRTRGGRASAADSIVRGVLEMARPSSMARANDFVARTDLLMIAQRWSDALSSLDRWAARLDSLERSGGEWPRSIRAARTRLAARRAVVFLHLGRPAEALAIDSALAVRENVRWDQGQSALARAVIAAHRGEADRAIALIQTALRQGATGFLDLRAYPSIEAEPLFAPIAGDRRFLALARPDAS